MLITNGKLMLEQDFNYRDLLVKDGRIVEILPHHSGYQDEDVYDAHGSVVTPGFIDLEVHGAMGYDMSDAVDEAYDTVSRELLKHGVTSYIGAVDSFDEDILEEAYTAAGEWISGSHAGARMLGLQMRGPFLNPEMAGPQNRRFLRSPDVALYKKLQAASGGNILFVNVSPELEGAFPFIREVSKTAKVMLSNSTAGFDTARMGYAWSAYGCSDLFRNMNYGSAFDPGLPGATMDIARAVTMRYDNDSVVHPSLLRMTFNEFYDRLCLVSGCTAFSGLPAGSYEIEDHTVHISRAKALFEDGSDAGSIMYLDACVQNVMGMGALPLPIAVFAVTEIPARVLGIFDEVGSITVGKRADLTVLDLHSHEVQSVFQNGILTYDERKNYD